MGEKTNLEMTSELRILLDFVAMLSGKLFQAHSEVFKLSGEVFQLLASHFTSFRGELGLNKVIS